MMKLEALVFKRPFYKELADVLLKNGVNGPVDLTGRLDDREKFLWLEKGSIDKGLYYMGPNEKEIIEFAEDEGYSYKIGTYYPSNSIRKLLSNEEVIFTEEYLKKWLRDF